MRKKSIILALLALSMMTVACSPVAETISDSNSSASGEGIKSIVISSPDSMKVGETIRLSIDVLESDDDKAVHIAVSNPTIAKLDGIWLTGLAMGTVSVTVSSDKNPDIKATKDITIVGNEVGSISLEAYENEKVSFDSSTNHYTVPKGEHFKIKYVLKEGTPANFKSVSYSVLYPSSHPDGLFHLTHNQDNTATAQALNSYDSISILAKFSYDSNTLSDLEASIQLRVVDANKENKEKFDGITSTVDESSLSESKRIVLWTRTVGDNRTEERSIFTHKSYSDHTLIEEVKTTMSDGNAPQSITNNYYSGVSNDKYHVFSYLKEIKKPQTIYVDEAANGRDGSLYFDVSTGSVITGYKELLKSFFSSSSRDEILLFGNSYLSSRSNFIFADYSTNINATYTDPNGTKYEANFVLNHEGSKFNGYSFTETITDGETTTTYLDMVDGLKYEGKVDDPNSKIDFTTNPSN